MQPNGNNFNNDNGGNRGGARTGSAGVKELLANGLISTEEYEYLKIISSEVNVSVKTYKLRKLIADNRLCLNILF